MTEVSDSHISVRFRHGIHTIYLFIDALAPLSNVTTELLSLLRERYPQGLTSVIGSESEEPIITPIPEARDAEIAYALLNVPTDPSKGWKRLKTGERGEYTPTKAGMRENSIVAFAFVGDEDEDVVFEVEWPQEDDEMYDQV